MTMTTVNEVANQGSFKTRKQSPEVDDFSLMFNRLNSTEFAMAMHEKLKKHTTIIRKSRDQFDLHDINRLLTDFPSLYSWAIVEAELIEEKVQEAQYQYDTLYRELYDTANDELIHEGHKKPTQALIESRVVKNDLRVIQQKRESLLITGKSSDEIDSELYYYGLSGLKCYCRELQTKARIAKEHCRVWASTVSTLQSLSKNITLELTAQNRGGI